MRTYRTSRRRDTVEFFLEALQLSGSTILDVPDPNRAPYLCTIKTPARDHVQLICYAFRATEYGKGGSKRGRPADEHRIQVKYGSDDKSYHHLFMPESGHQLTLMFGVHLDEQILVAVDPAMHAYTRFFKSIEFKAHHISEIKKRGWLGWERERSPARRILAAPMEDFRTEVLLGFRPEYFTQYVEFERAAVGLSPGERLLIADRLARPRHPHVHRYEREFGLSAREILETVEGAFRLEAALRGRVAEHYLETLLKASPGVDNVVALDEDGAPDFRVNFRGHEPVLIECKRVLRRTSADGHARVDFQKTRASKGNPCSRYYRPDQFDVLAACLHPVTEEWTFSFCPTRALAKHPKCEGCLSQNVLVKGGDWRRNLTEVLHQVTACDE